MCCINQRKLNVIFLIFETPKDCLLYQTKIIGRLQLLVLILFSHLLQTGIWLLICTCLYLICPFSSLSSSQSSHSSNRLPWRPPTFPFMATVPSVRHFYPHRGSQTPRGPIHVRRFMTGLKRIWRTSASKLLYFIRAADKSRLKAKLPK